MGSNFLSLEYKDFLGAIMNIQEMVIEGRKYKAYVSPDEQDGAYVILGPPEGLVDMLDLPVSTATRLHNILYDRGIFNYAEASKRGVLPGVLQELFATDAQLLLEKFNEFERETIQEVS